MKRRSWLLGAAAGGALIVGWGLLPQRSRLGSGALMQAGEGDIALNGWIKITPDSGVVLAMPRSEMGQGVHTALPMLAAEELDVPLEAVRIEQAGADAIYGNIAMLQGSPPFHPLDEEDLRQALRRLAAGPATAPPASQRRALEFTWERAARQTLDCLEAAYRKRSSS